MAFDRLVRSHRARAGCAGIVALALAAAASGAGCSMDTHYVPRTPHAVTLGMKRGALAVYKDGALTEVGDIATAVRGCAPAAGDASEAASHYSAYRRNASIAGVFNALGVFAFPMFGVGTYFNIRAASHQQQSNAFLIDAINRHNDAQECVR